MNRTRIVGKVCLTIVGTLAIMSASCNNGETRQAADEPKERRVENIAGMAFDELFIEISPKELSGNVFKLFGEDFTVITSGSDSAFNSMTAGYGGWGIQFGLPSTWAFLRASRYTLEIIRREQTYTMSWFDEEHKDAVMYFGSKTGRGTDKMANNPLTAVSTPDGNIAYKEANLIIECKLMQITTVSPDDFYSEKGKQFVIDGFNDALDYHKLVFGEITKVWVRR